LEEVHDATSHTPASESMDHFEEDGPEPFPPEDMVGFVYPLSNRQLGWNRRRAGKNIGYYEQKFKHPRRW